MPNMTPAMPPSAGPMTNTSWITRIHVDAHEAGRVAVLGHRPDGHPEDRAVDEQQQGHHEEDREGDDEDLGVGDLNVGDDDLPVRDELRECLVPPPCDEHDGILQDDGDTQHADQGRDAGGIGDRPVGEALGCRSKEGGADAGGEEGQQQDADHHDPNAHGRGSNGGERKEREVRSRHEQFTVGEVEELEQAVDHGVAQCDERIERPEHETVHDLLE